MLSNQVKRFRLWRPAIWRCTALIFGSGGVALLFVLLFTAHRIEQLNSIAETSRASSARLEVVHAIQSTLARSRSMLREVALWDETRAQLGDPSDYAFWQSAQLMNPARVPHYVESMELYRPSGEALGVGNTPVLPNRISGPDMYGIAGRDGARLRVFIPVLGPHGDQSPIGYVGVQLNLVDAVTEISKFDSLKPETLRFPIPEGERAPVLELADRASFELTEFSHLEPLLVTIRQSMILLVLVNLIVLLLGLWLVRRYLTDPLNRLVEYVRALDRAPNQPPAPPGMAIRELAGLVRALSRYDQRIRKLKRDLDHKNAELWELAHLDSLTQVGNRLAFADDWGQILTGQERRLKELAFLMFDCDGLKAINDRYGHAVGDEVIRRIATSLNTSLRDEDTLYRMGGDEFATILKNSDRFQARRIGQRCIAAVSGLDVSDLGMDRPLAVSVGLAHSAYAADLVQDLPELADQALYEGKGQGVVMEARKLDQSA